MKINITIKDINDSFNKERIIDIAQAVDKRFGEIKEGKFSFYDNKVNAFLEY